jgi:glutamate dehydrogenase (NAD(P)+)
MTTASYKNYSALEAAELRVREAGEWLKLEDGLIETIVAPRRIIEVAIPFRRDDGSRDQLTGWRVHHNTTRGPAKGGIRYHHEVNREEVIALAMGMSLKTAIANLPLGGAKGGVCFNPKDYSIGEIERITRRYVSEISSFLGPDKDVPAPDVGTNSQIMAWIMDQYSTGVGHATPGVVTGKPIELGGSLGRESATGRGVVEAAALMLGKMGTSLQGKKLPFRDTAKLDHGLLDLPQRAEHSSLGSPMLVEPFIQQPDSTLQRSTKHSAKVHEVFAIPALAT